MQTNHVGCWCRYLYLYHLFNCNKRFLCNIKYEHGYLHVRWYQLFPVPAATFMDGSTHRQHASGNRRYPSVPILCVVNLLIPSQGGQFTVQGPLIVQAAQSIPGTNLFNCLNGFVFGDECTNLLQPLYVIPALSVVGMKLKDVWGFMAFMCVFWVVITCLGLYFIPMFI